MPVPPHVFGCSATALTFAGFEREGDGLVLTEHRTEELPADTFQHGLLGGPPREPRSFDERIAAFVESLDTSVSDASLVLPDTWLRTAFAEIAELPTDARGRDEVLRWKLKRLVPYRVDELRVRATEVPPLVGQDEPRRLLLGFGLEGLFGHLESGFAGAGVRLGRISNEGLSAVGALSEGALGGEGALTALMIASDSGYTLVITRGREPVMHRFKSFADALPDEARGASVIRDLRLTGTFLEEHFPDQPVGRFLLAASEDEAPRWARWVEEGEVDVLELLGREHTVPLRVADGRGSGPFDEFGTQLELLPLMGAVCQEVAS